MSNEGHYDFNTNSGQTREVTAADRPEYSQVLGPDGKPLKYEIPRVGFDLTPKRSRKRGTK